ncbi:response regulator transcription factor [Nitrosomonas sp. Is35]|uniref:response regulator transcription factor n=1 Tax=Nitrosomonas sp. Is35 TaxID=3080534 RepID=UPI00294B5025|nr:response regulator transcription factor [Nitrosomonas sp. Is35]MDV6347575.1 response regulator transcription factor [Nitrosomonas sp. Is35]
MKSFIDIQCLKTDKKRQECSDSAALNRRLLDRRREQFDRRNISILRGQARYDRRRNDRRDLSMLHKQPHNMCAELVNAGLTPLFSTAKGYRADLLRIWAITEQADLNTHLRNYSDNSPYICINQYNLKEVETASAKLGEIYPDAILIDMRLAADKVVEQLRMIRKKMASAKIILLYEKNPPDFIDEIIEFRISGFLPVGADHKIFEKAIQVIVHREELWFPHHVVQRIFDVLSGWHNISCAIPSRDIALTKSEQEIVKLVAKGLTNKQIALQLSVSPETVKKHLKSVFIKTGVRNRSQLVFGYLSRIGVYS